MDDLPIKRLATLALAVLAVIFMIIDGVSVILLTQNFLILMVLVFLAVVIILGCMGKTSQNVVIMDLTFGILIILYWANSVTDLDKRSGLGVATILSSILTGAALILFSFI